MFNYNYKNIYCATYTHKSLYTYSIKCIFRNFIKYHRDYYIHNG